MAPADSRQRIMKMTTFIVNEKEKELTMMVNGIDISADFIGNTIHGMASDDEGRYIASQEDFDWWKDVIDQTQEMEAIIASYKLDNDPGEVDAVVQDWITNDLDLNLAQVKMGLAQHFG